MARLKKRGAGRLAAEGELWKPGAAYASGVPEDVLEGVSGGLVDLLFLGAFLFFWGLGGWADGCLGWEIAVPKVSTSLAVSA